MKTLLVLRHAKSSWSDDNLVDHDRPLNTRGLHDAPRIGKTIRDEGLTPELIRCSTALRATQTAELVAKHSGYSQEIEFTPDLYGAASWDCLSLLQDTPDEVSSVMIVAHNPGLEELVAILSDQHERFPTAALALFEFDVLHWSEINEKSPVELKHLWRPKELD